MKRVVIVGSRHRGWKNFNASVADARLVQKILFAAIEAYGVDGFYVLGLGADAGFGEMVKRECVTADVSYAEFVLRFHAGAAGRDLELLSMARHAALMEMGTEFHIFVSKSRATQIEDLVQRCEGDAGVAYALYDEEQKVFRRSR